MINQLFMGAVSAKLKGPVGSFFIPEDWRDFYEDFTKP
jgi:hypothetical protein